MTPLRRLEIFAPLDEPEAAAIAHAARVAGYDPAALNPSLYPLSWPALPVLPAMAILAAALAAVAAPPPPAGPGAPGPEEAAPAGPGPRAAMAALPGAAR